MVQRPLGNHHHGPDTLLVTSDATSDAISDAISDATYDAVSGTKALHELIGRARVVLWDFDGPVCRLFAGHSARRVARALVEWLEGQGLRGLLEDGERDTADPHVVLRAVDRRHPGSDLLTELEEHLTRHELRAVSSAMPTAFADPLIRTWAAVGVRLAVATNNSPRGVRAYLDGRGLADCFPYIYGRTADLHLLKPHPHCLHLALNATGAAPEEALMIGDTATDFQAAATAGVPFLGYARNLRKEKRLREAGATTVVNSLEPVLDAVRRRDRAAGAP
ncbi:HAD family hydrolase [Streptomyces sp. NPDC053367]|uniref:HAD family hydrolase n=1 Tax=Streptomyces sp. NPDC053367 TaxID=3365700 RepID=UPI0037D3E6E1